MTDQRKRVGERGFAAFIIVTVERELRGQILDDYLADYERRKGPISKQKQDQARQIFDEVFADYTEDG